MSIIAYIVLTILLCVLPAGVVWLCNRYSILGKLGPIMVLYAVGMVMGNIPAISSYLTPLQDVIPNVMVPLAIPMMLYGCAFSRREAGLQLKVVVSGFLSVCLAVTAGYVLFGCHVNEGAEVGGIISGMYTGGTINAAALQAIFKVKSETFILINSYDIIISFIYFVFLFSVGVKLFRILFGERKLHDSDQMVVLEDKAKNPYKQFFTRHGLRQVAQIFGVTILIVALSAATTLLFDDSWFMVVFILMLTTLGVVCSFIKPIRALEKSYDLGMYLIYIFSLAIASMADFSSLDFVGGANQLCFMLFAVFVSLLLHAIMCRLMKVDADSMVISSVSFINSPPFVPMVSAAMKNRNTLVTGLAAGVAGYALGNHFGVLMEKLLSLL